MGDFSCNTYSNSCEFALNADWGWRIDTNEICFFFEMHDEGEIQTNADCVGVVLFEYLGVGLGTAAFVAFLARTTNKRFNKHEHGYSTSN